MRSRFQWQGVFVVLLFLMATSELYASEKVNFVIPDKIFGKLRKSDVLASLRGWANMVNERIKMDLDVSFIVDDDVEAIRKGLQEKRFDMLVVLSDVFVKLERSEAFYKLRFPVLERNLRTEVLMVVAADSNYNHFDDLKGERVSVVYSEAMKIAQLWHETFLFARGVRDEERYYREVHYKRNASQAVLSVFFGKTDVCFVSRSAFELMKEMNPQVGQKLKILEKSPPFASIVFAVRKTFQKPYVDEVFSIIDEVYESPEGQQILMLVRFEAMVKADASYLDTVRELVKQHEELETALLGHENKNMKPFDASVFGLKEGE